MSSERRTKKEGERTLKYQGEITSWSTIAHLRRDKRYEVIGHDSSSSKCFARPPIRKRSNRKGAPDPGMDSRASDGGTKLSSIAEHIIVEPPISSGGRREAADLDPPNPPTTMDPPRSVSVYSKKSSSRPPSLNASRPEPSIGVHGGEPQEGNGNEERVDAEGGKVEVEVEVAEEAVGENVTSVSVAGES
jgi:hypothetical protein